MPYWIACESNMIELQNTVSEAIDERDYQPAGGIFFNLDTGYFSQALWKLPIQKPISDIMEIP